MRRVLLAIVLIIGLASLVWADFQAGNYLRTVLQVIEISLSEGKDFGPRIGGNRWGVAVKGLGYTPRYGVRAGLRPTWKRRIETQHRAYSLYFHRIAWKAYDRGQKACGGDGVMKPSGNQHRPAADQLQPFTSRGRFSKLKCGQS